MKQTYSFVSGMIASILLMTLIACSTTTHLSTRIVPEPIIPTQAERAIMKEHIPGFYVRFAEQQRQLMEARGTAP